MIINFKDHLQHKNLGRKAITGPFQLTWEANENNEFMPSDVANLISVTATWEFRTTCLEGQTSLALAEAEKSFTYYTYGEILNRLIEIKIDLQEKIGIHDPNVFEKIDSLIKELKGEVYGSY